MRDNKIGRDEREKKEREKEIDIIIYVSALIPRATYLNGCVLHISLVRNVSQDNLYFSLCYLFCFVFLFSQTLVYIMIKVKLAQTTLSGRDGNNI